MHRLQIEALLKEVSEGRTGVNDALVRLRDLPFEDLGFAKVDHHRALRTGMPEVIFAEGKTTAQVAAIFSRMAQAGGNDPQRCQRLRGPCARWREHRHREHHPALPTRRDCAR